MNGKNKCKILKEIRQKIADENDIPFVTAECKYQGNCSGTCPKCEEELAYLERELKKRQTAGKCIVIAGVAAASALLTLKLGHDAMENIKRQLQKQGIVEVVGEAREGSNHTPLVDDIDDIHDVP